LKMKSVTMEYKPLHVLYKERENLLTKLANVVVDINKKLEEKIDKNPLNKYSEEIMKLNLSRRYVPAFLKELGKKDEDVYNLLKKQESLCEKLHQVELQIRLEEE